MLIVLCIGVAMYMSVCAHAYAWCMHERYIMYIPGMLQVWCKCGTCMLQGGADVNMGSPLLAASKTGDTATVLALIRAGALVDVAEPIPGGHSCYCARCLSRNCFCHSPRICSHSHCVGQRNQSALVATANRGHKEVVAALMKAGARDWRCGVQWLTRWHSGETLESERRVHIALAKGQTAIVTSI